MAYITARDVSLGYEGTVVTEGLNFQVNKGDYLCIAGENGAGKTTLMKAMLGLLAPVRGEILYGDGMQKNRIGYLPQHTAVQKDFPASVWEIVMSGNLSKCGFRPFYKKTEMRTAKEKMENMAVWDLRNKSYRNLSGGQQQRVLLARALCAATDVLLLDEPVSGLDPKVTADLYELIRDLNRQGITIIMISHDITAAVKYADHILHIGKKQLFFGKAEDYKMSDAWSLFKARGELEHE